LSDISTTSTSSWQIFEKFFKYQISWKFVQWEPTYSVRTETRDEARNRRFTKFCKHASKFVHFFIWRLHYFLAILKKIGTHQYFFLKFPLPNFATNGHWRFGEGTRKVHRHVCQQLTFYCFWRPVLTLQMSDTARHSTARHGRARPLSAYCSCASAANFLKNSFFHVQKWLQFTDFCFWTQLFYNYVSRACNSVTLPCVLSNERVSLSYGGVINILYNLDLPDTKFLGKYLLNLHRAICSTTQNRLGSMFQCSQVQHKVSFISCSN